MKPPLRCTECGRRGHLCNRYWQFVGYPIGREPWNRPTPSLLSKPPTSLSPMCHQASTTTISSPLLGLSLDLYQKLLDLLSPKPSFANFVDNVSTSHSFYSRREWVMDSRASDHMCHNRTLFTSHTSSSHEQLVILRTSRTLQIEGVGTCTLT